MIPPATLPRGDAPMWLPSALDVRVAYAHGEAYVGVSSRVQDWGAVGAGHTNDAEVLGLWCACGVVLLCVRVVNRWAGEGVNKNA